MIHLKKVENQYFIWINQGHRHFNFSYLTLIYLTLTYLTLIWITWIYIVLGLPLSNLFTHWIFIEITNFENVYIILMTCTYNDIFGSERRPRLPSRLCMNITKLVYSLNTWCILLDRKAMTKLNQARHTWLRRTSEGERDERMRLWEKLSELNW